MAVKRLGKGLSALIPDVPATEDSATHSERLRDIDVSKVQPNPFQPRESFDQTALDELKQSIAENGVIQPITVRVVEDGYELIAGERRLRAVQQLEVERIPAYILDVRSDEEMIEMSLIENIQRENLNPIDEARGYQTLITRCNLTQDEVAKRVGKNRSTITNSLRMLKLPKQIQESLIKAEISSGHARAFLSFEGTSEQLAAWKKTVKNNYTVRQVENLAQAKSKPRPKPSSRPHETDPFVQDLENRLRTALSTQVRIKQTKKGGGVIELEFYSESDLERILELLENS